jgi:xanthine dehydrogenase/oxidase
VLGFKALLDNCKYFAGNQVRNVACLAGNICTASPISDLNPVFVALNAILTFECKENGARELPIREFFLGYRRTAIKPTEALTRIFVPFGKPNQYSAAFKQAKRKDDDIAIVNAGLSLTLSKENGKLIVQEACFAFGGLAAITAMANKTVEFIKGKEWGNETIQKCFSLVLEDFALSAVAPGGQIEYRKTLGILY